MGTRMRAAMGTTLPMTAAAALAAVLLTPVHAGAAVPPTSGDCAAGELCLREKPEFKGHRQAYELSGIDIESCVALPEGSAQALANRTGRPVTAYQSAECAETGSSRPIPAAAHGRLNLLTG